MVICCVQLGALYRLDILDCPHCDIPPILALCLRQPYRHLSATFGIFPALLPAFHFRFAANDPIPLFRYSAPFR